jgi:type VI secretion system secreted protein VgrG
MGETTARLARAKKQHETLGDLAQQHQAQDEQDQEVVSQEIKAQNAAIQGKAAAKSEPGSFPELQEPHLVLASPAGIQSTTAGSTHQHSQVHHAITAGQHISQSSGASILSSAAKHIRAFAQLGIRLIAGKGKVQIQANGNSIEVIANKVMEIIGKEGITLRSDQLIRLGTGPHAMQLTPGGGIELLSPQPVLAHTASVSIDGAKGASPVAMPTFASVQAHRALQVQYHDLESVQGAPFTIEYADGSQFKGTLNAQGQADLSNAPVGSGVIRLQDDTRPFEVIADESSPLHKANWNEADMEGSLKAAQATGATNARRGL